MLPVGAAELAGRRFQAAAGRRARADWPRADGRPCRDRARPRARQQNGRPRSASRAARSPPALPCDRSSDASSPASLSSVRANLVRSAPPRLSRYWHLAWMPVRRGGRRLTEQPSELVQVGELAGQLEPGVRWRHRACSAARDAPGGRRAALPGPACSARWPRPAPWRRPSPQAGRAAPCQGSTGACRGCGGCLRSVRHRQAEQRDRLFQVREIARPREARPQRLGRDRLVRASERLDGPP